MSESVSSSTDNALSCVEGLIGQLKLGRRGKTDGSGCKHDQGIGKMKNEVTMIGLALEGGLRPTVVKTWGARLENEKETIQGKKLWDTLRLCRV